MSSKTRLTTIMYHYVRDVAGTKYPSLNAMAVDAFKQQISDLSRHYEFASLESTLKFLAGQYTPQKDLCLLTFDDGFKEHYEIVTPILQKHKIQGLFFLPSACIEEGKVLAVHKNHFLMSFLEFNKYRSIFIETMGQKFPSIAPSVSRADAKKTYRWDNDEVADFKFLINYKLSKETREELLDEIFAQTFGDEKSFADELYLNWDEARRMQESGMLIGGHSHNHCVLSDYSYDHQKHEIETCMNIFQKRLGQQNLWPFSYPFGKPSTYTNETIQLLETIGFNCAFSTKVGAGHVACDKYEIPRVDPKDV